jgi:hypothetical protein
LDQARADPFLGADCIRECFREAIREGVRDLIEDRKVTQDEENQATVGATLFFEGLLGVKTRRINGG